MGIEFCPYPYMGMYIHTSVTFVVVFSSPQFLLQYLMQGLKLQNILHVVQTYIEHVHKENRILIQVIIAELCHMNDIYIFTI